MLCQQVNPKSNISHFLPFSVLDSALWFFIKTHPQLRKNKLKIIFAPSLEFLTVSPTNLVNWHVAGFGACSANYCTKNQIWDILALSLLLVLLFVFIKTGLWVRKSNLQIIFDPSLGCLRVSRPNLVNLYLPGFEACSANQCTQNQI